MNRARDNRPRNSRFLEGRLAATVSLAISLILAWVVVSAVAWRQTAGAETPPRQEAPPRIDIAQAPEPQVPERLHAPVALPPPPVPEVKTVAAPASLPAPVSVPVSAPVSALARPEPEQAKPEPPEPLPVPAHEDEPVPDVPVAVASAPVAPPGPDTPQPDVERPALTPDREMVREGRVLLKLLEKGEGPDIEIAWPKAPDARARLYEVFDACFGMRTVVAGPDGGLYTADLPPGRSWIPDPDGVSGYARQPRGALPAPERARVEAIRARHGLSGGTVIRVFPRDVDAGFLGALEAVATDAYRAGGVFRATYELTPGGVRITGIRADGRDVGQPVLLGGGC